MLGPRAYLFLKKQKMLRYDIAHRLPRQAEIEIASVCNYHCQACTFGNGMLNRPKTLLSKEKFKEIFLKLKNDGVEKIDINCIGEPFLNPDIYDIFDMMLSYNYAVTLPTNGSLIDVEKMKKYDKRITLFYSLDSIYYPAYAAYRRCSENLFKQALDNLKKLSQTNIGLKVGILVSRHNEGHLADIIKFTEELGLAYQLSKIHCSAFGVKQEQLPKGVSLTDNYIGQRYIAPQDYDELAPQKKEFSSYNMYRYDHNLKLFVNCQRQVKMCHYVDYPGLPPRETFLPCCFTAYYTNIKFGNIFKAKTFKELWFAHAFINFRRQMLNAPQANYGPCRICTAKGIN